MFDTYVTVTGNALTTPERRVTKSNLPVAFFRVASTARRYDRNTNEWVDAANLRIRVTCWRRLADNVAASIVSGDPVVVHGRISTRDWVTEQGEPRIAYELEAVSVGHDLSRGTGTFTRSRHEPAGLVVEDPDDDPMLREQESFTTPDDDTLAVIAEAGVTVPEPGDEEVAEDEEEALAGSARGRRRPRQPVPA